MTTCSMLGVYDSCILGFFCCSGLVCPSIIKPFLPVNTDVTHVRKDTRFSLTILYCKQWKSRHGLGMRLGSKCNLGLQNLVTTPQVERKTRYSTEWMKSHKFACSFLSWEDLLKLETEVSISSLIPIAWGHRFAMKLIACTVTQDLTAGKLAILTWKYLHLLKMGNCDFC